MIGFVKFTQDETWTCAHAENIMRSTGMAMHSLPLMNWSQCMAAVSGNMIKYPQQHMGPLPDPQWGGRICERITFRNMTV